MSRILVMHEAYGCDTGCCGHVMFVDGQRVGEFNFSHAYGEEARDLAEQMVVDELGWDHVADLDWDNCVIVGDD